MKIDSFKVGKRYDRRRKLTDKDKAEIKRLYFEERLGIREISRMYETKCCRRTIQFTLFPERLATVNFPGHYKKYYDTDKWRETMREHRSYKKQLMVKKGLI